MGQEHGTHPAMHFVIGGVAAACAGLPCTPAAPCARLPACGAVHPSSSDASAAAAVSAAPPPSAALEPGSREPTLGTATLRTAWSSRSSSGRRPSCSSAGTLSECDAGPADPALFATARGACRPSGRHSMCPVAKPGADPDAGPALRAMACGWLRSSGSSGCPVTCAGADRVPDPDSSPADAAPRTPARGASRSSGRQRSRGGLPGHAIWAQELGFCGVPGPLRASSRVYAPPASRGASRAAPPSPKPGAPATAASAKCGGAAVRAAEVLPGSGSAAGCPSSPGAAAAASARPASNGARAAVAKCAERQPCQGEGAAGARPRRGGESGSSRVQPGAAGGATMSQTWDTSCSAGSASNSSHEFCWGQTSLQEPDTVLLSESRHRLDAIQLSNAPACCAAAQVLPFYVGALRTLNGCSSAGYMWDQPDGAADQLFILLPQAAS